MLEKVCREIRNYFVKSVHTGRFVIENSAIQLPFLVEGQYFRVEGSVLNDGIYQYPATSLQDEAFSGRIVAMAIPPAFLELVEKIKDFDAKNVVSPYTSESWGGYSYTRATDGNGQAVGWKTAFAKELNAWRKI